MSIFSRRSLFSGLFLVLFLCFAPLAIHAQEEEVSGDINNAAPVEIKAGEAKYIYEKPSRQKFSRLYWALGMLDVNNDTDIDNFLQINECDIYKDYFYNEFEWKSVRESGRQFLIENMSKFPLRFEISQPLLLGEYDVKTQEFAVLPDYQITGTARLEVFPGDFADVVCQDDGSSRIRNIPHYPLGIVAEVNRPIELTKIPVKEDIAREYINQKMEVFKNLRSDKQNQENLYSFRDAYIFLHVKFFAYRGEFLNRQNYSMAEIMTVLEGYEIYADKEKKILLYSQDFRKKKHKKKPGEEVVGDKYETDFEAPEAEPAVAPESVIPAEEKPFSPQTPGAVVPLQQGQQ